MIVQALRSVVFYLMAFIVTLILATIVAVSTPFSNISRNMAVTSARIWTKSMQFLLRYIVGIHTIIEGLENIPEGNYIIASKHQSDWDTIALYSLFNSPSFIAKKQLFSIPLLGQTLRLMGTISIDRSRGSKAVPEMLVGTQHAIAAGRNVLIFPEGTRKVPLAKPNYKLGAARVYEASDVPILPVAVCSGLFWGRNSLILWPGKATARILPPIPAGLSRDEAHARMSQEIEHASIQLALEAVDRGLSRPIDNNLRDAISKAQANNNADKTS